MEEIPRGWILITLMLYDLELTQINSTHFHVKGNRGILREINQLFTFRAPNFFFHPKYKAKQWDGYIKIFSLKNCLLYCGLLPHLKEFCKRGNYSVNIKKRAQPEEFAALTDEDFKTKVSKYNIHSKGEKIDPYVYQLAYAYTAIKKRNMLIKSPTSSGKSLIIYMIIRMIQDHYSGKILLVVPTISLTYQMFTDFEDYSSEVSWNAEDHCHQIIAGKQKDSSKQIYISTFQSIAKMPDDYFKKFDAVIVDETHKATSVSIKNILEKSINTNFRIGLTGTLKNMKTEQLVLEGLMGPVMSEVSTADLMKSGHISNLNIDVLRLEYTEEDKKMCLKAKYQDEMSWLYHSAKRTDFITNLAMAQKKNTLILFEHIYHGNDILQTLFKKRKLLKTPNRPIYLVSGKIKAEEREEIRHKLEEDANAIIVASTGVFSTGVNVKNLHVIIFSAPSKSEVKVLQSIGRGLRLAKNKASVRLYDIVDDLSHKKWRNYAMKHFAERLTFYNLEKFNYKLKSFKLN